MASTQNKKFSYPEPLIVPPVREHKHTFILLHGRGGNGPDFGPQLLSVHTPNLRSLPKAFPHAKFVFPTAAKRRAAGFNRALLTQWFDIVSPKFPSERLELQLDGLRETTAFIHGLLREEIALVGAKNVVLGGLSQGCASSLVALLTWDGEPLAAVVGMCGWLPLRDLIEDVARDLPERAADDEDDFFTHSDEEDDEDDPLSTDKDQPLRQRDKDGSRKAELPLRAVSYLLEELDMLASVPSLSHLRTPVFLGHGVEDDVVPIHLGRETTSCLEALGIDVAWKAYEGLEHWYSLAMLRDMADFIVENSALEKETRD